MRSGLGLLLAAMLAATPAAAAGPGEVEIGEIAGGYTYYNRPGATLEEHNRDFGECAQTTSSPGGEPNAYNMGIAFGLIWSGPIAGLVAVRTENCMIVRGWRVVELDAKEGQALSALDAASLRERLAPELGAAQPRGTIVRWWNNEALNPATYGTASRPRAPGKKQLSMRLYAEAAPAPLKYVPLPVPLKTDPNWPTKPLKPEELASAPPGSAILLVRVFDISNRNGTGVAFQRMGLSPEDQPSERDGLPGWAFGGTGFLFAKREGNWFAIAVPPGRWRISGSGFVNYCLGSPSFELKAGEIVYAGSFRLGGPSLVPDVDLAAPRAWVGPQAADRVRAAEYMNGSTGDCHVFGVVYALEFPGLPFQEGYRWGGAPQAR